MKKKTLTFLLALALIFTMIPATASAATETCIGTSEEVGALMGRVYSNPDFHPVKMGAKKGAYGMADRTGKLLVAVEYDSFIEADSPTATYAALKKNGKWGVVNNKSQVVIPFENDYIYFYPENDLILVEINGKYGLYNSKGQVILPPVLNSKILIEDGYVIYNIGNCYGAIKTTGENVLACEYESLEYQKNDYFIAAQGNGIVRGEYRNNMALIKVGKSTKYGSFKALEPRYLGSSRIVYYHSASNYFSNDRAYLVTTANKKISLPTYKPYRITSYTSQVGGFNKYGLAQVFCPIGPRTYYAGIIDKNGKVIVPYTRKYSVITYFNSSGYALAYGSTFDIINTKGKVVKRLKNSKYSAVNIFDHSMPGKSVSTDKLNVFVVHDESKDLFYFMTKNGTILKDGGFRYIARYEGGFAAQKNSLDYEYYDKNGKLVPKKFGDNLTWKNGIAQTQDWDKNLTNYVDKTGKVIYSRPIEDDLSKILTYYDSEGMMLTEKGGKIYLSYSSELYGTVPALTPIPAELISTKSALTGSAVKIVTDLGETTGISIVNGSVKEGTQVRNNNADRLTISKDSKDGYFNIKAGTDSKKQAILLGVREGKQVAGNDLILWSKTGSDSQRFKFEFSGDTAYISTVKGLYLKNVSKGNKVVLTDNKSEAAKWYVIKYK